MSQYDALLKPLTIKNVTIRNRVFSSSHSPGYAKGGHITDRYLRYHEEKAKGGIGLTQFGGATGVSVENSYHYGQVNGSEDWIIPEYQKMAAGIHKHGAKCTVQLTHGGRRERWDAENWFPAYSPSCRREPVHRAFPAEMEDHDMRRIAKDYGQAVRRAKEGHLDGVELSFQAGTLIEQFWSPAMNFRTDKYGGSLENRVRFGLEVLEEVRKVNGDYLVGIRMPGDEMLKDGLNQRDCIEIAKIYAKSGMVDFISVVAAQGSDAVSSALIWPTMWVPPAGWLPLASAVKAEVDVPIIHAARIADLPTANRAVEEGHVDMVGMTRAFIADPHLLKKTIEGREDDVRQCVGAGYCVDRIISGHDTLCVQNAATSREATMPHVVTKSANGVKRAVVVGAGPGGLEAARVLAERGHKVTLFEREAETGGQVNIAAKAPWRVSIQGVQRWLDAQVRKLGVEIRTGVEAGADDVTALKPDVVIVATGGRPNKGWFTGGELAVSTWDILSGKIEPAENVLLYDENGGPQGSSAAEFIAKRGSKVEIATTDRTICMEMGDTNAAAFLKELYQAGAVISPDQRLTQVYREGNQLVAVLANVFTHQEEERVVDQVVGECGTMPNDSLYFALKPLAKNQGEVDLRAVAAAKPSAVESNPVGAFQLFRVGDAWASRNIHAAIYDSLRLCKDI